MKHIEPIAMKAGDTRVKINGEPVKVDFRIIAESEYQRLVAASGAQSDRDIAIGEHAFKAGFDEGAAYGPGANEFPSENLSWEDAREQAWSEYTPPEFD